MTFLLCTGGGGDGTQVQYKLLLGVAWEWLTNVCSTLRREVSAVFPSLFSPPWPTCSRYVYNCINIFSNSYYKPCRERVGGFKVTWTSFRPEVFWLSRVDSECVSATQIVASVLLEFPSNFVSGWNFAWLSFARKVKILGDGYFQVAARWMNSDFHSLAEHFEDLGTCQIVQHCLKILLSLLVCNRY